MKILDTARLTLRLMNEDDAPFMLALMNQPDWHRYIGDRGLRTDEAMREFIRTGPMASQQKMGFSFYVAERREDGIPVGIAGLVKRPQLDDIDIGYGFLETWRGRGYAWEATAAVLHDARTRLGITRIAAITSPDNVRSIRIVERLGLRPAGMIAMKGGEPDTNLYLRDFAADPDGA